MQTKNFGLCYGFGSCMLHTSSVMSGLADELGLRVLRQSNYQQQRNFLHWFLSYTLGDHAGMGLDLGTDSNTVCSHMLAAGPFHNCARECGREVTLALPLEMCGNNAQYSFFLFFLRMVSVLYNPRHYKPHRLLKVRVLAVQWVSCISCVLCFE